MRLRSVFCALFTSLAGTIGLISSPAHAQAFNLDIGTSINGAPGYGAPFLLFGGTANQGGTWNSLEGTATSLMLNNLIGAATTVTVTRTSAGGGDFNAQNENTAFDSEKLLDDGQDLSSAGGAVTYTFSNLAAGTYRLFTYAVAPDILGVDPTSVTVNGVQRIVTGPIPAGNNLVLGQTYAKHEYIAVAAGGSISVTAAGFGGYGTVNGFQLQPMPIGFNVDIGRDAGTGAPAPGPGFGAATGYKGFWNNFTGGLSIPLVGLNGAPTAVSLSRSSASGNSFSSNNVNTSGDSERLLDDGQDLQGTGGVTYTFSNLPGGHYSLYTYAVAPDIEFVDQTSVVVNGVQRIVTGPIPSGNNYVTNVTYCIHDGLFVTTGGSIAVQVVGFGGGIGTLNGLQLFPARVCGELLPTCSGDVFPAPAGDGLVNIDDLVTVITHWGENGGPLRPVGDCGPAPTGDCTVNIDDLVAVITSWGACPPATGACAIGGNCSVLTQTDCLAANGIFQGVGATCPPTGACGLPDNTCVVNSHATCILAGGLIWLPAATCADADGDRIPDVFELNNLCESATPPYYGTDPANPDTDGDGLKDGDEVYGTTGGLNLPLIGCNPLFKDLLLEVDWLEEGTGGFFHSHRPSVAAVNLLRQAFANSPLMNPCGSIGINLIIDYGQGGPLTGGNLIPGGDSVVVFATEFFTYKAANFASNRNGYFYYSIHCHQYDSATNNSAGVAQLNGDNHLVSLQTGLTDSNVSKMMMHEFGHNLNLHHGGNEALNNKPNYNSVMNYRYGFPGVDTNCNAVGDGALDYSHGVNIPLDELALNEAAGVCGFFPIDWNLSGGINVGLIGFNINCDAGFATNCGSGSANCSDSFCSVLHDFDDWANIAFTGLLAPSFAPKEIITCDVPLDAPRE